MGSQSQTQLSDWPLNFHLQTSHNYGRAKAVKFWKETGWRIREKSPASDFESLWRGTVWWLAWHCCRSSRQAVGKKSWRWSRGKWTDRNVWGQTICLSLHLTLVMPLTCRKAGACCCEAMCWPGTRRNWLKGSGRSWRSYTACCCSRLTRWARSAMCVTCIQVPSITAAAYFVASKSHANCSCIQV